MVAGLSGEYLGGSGRLLAVVSMRGECCRGREGAKCGVREVDGYLECRSYGGVGGGGDGGGGGGGG